MPKAGFDMGAGVVGDQIDDRFIDAFASEMPSPVDRVKARLQEGRGIADVMQPGRCDEGGASVRTERLSACRDPLDVMPTLRKRRGQKVARHQTSPVGVGHPDEAIDLRSWSKGLRKAQQAAQVVVNASQRALHMHPHASSASTPSGYPEL